MPNVRDVGQLRQTATSRLEIANEIQAEYEKGKAAGHASMPGAANVVLKR